MQMNNDKVRSPDNELPLVIFHWSLVIFFLCALSGREKKCIAGFQPAKVVLTQKELSRLRCRRDAGATIFSHDLCLRGETRRLAAAGSLSESQIWVMYGTNGYDVSYVSRFQDSPKTVRHPRVLNPKAGLKLLAARAVRRLESREKPS